MTDATAQEDQLLDKPQETPLEEPISAADLHTKSFTDLLTENTQSPTEPAPTEETPPEEATPKTPEPQVTPPQPVIDTKKLTDDISTQTAERIWKSLMPDEKDTSKAADEKRSELQSQLKELQIRAKAEGRNLTYEEALEFVAKHATKTAKEEILQELQAEAEAEEKKELEARVAKEKYETEQTTAWHSYWNEQLGELEKEGKITAVNPADTRTDEKGVPLDPGRRERYQLFNTMSQVSAQKQREGKAPILNLKEIYAFHYKAPTTQPAGADAPIAGAKKSVSATSSDQINYYKDVKGQSFEDILMGK